MGSTVDNTAVLRRPCGVRLAVRTVGVGPPVVLVNNFHMLGTSWRPVVDHLVRAGLRTVTYDLRNQGNGMKAGSAPVRFDDHVEDLALVVDHHRQLGERVCLVGTSISTLLVLELALARPDTVAGLVLVCPAFSPSGRLRRRLVTRSWLASLEAGGAGALFDHIFPLIVADQALHRDGRTRYRVQRRLFVDQFGTEALRENLLAGLGADDTPDRLAAVTHPILVVLGDGDFLWSTSMAEQATDLFTNCRTVTMPRAGHLPYLDDPAGFAAIVAEFMSGDQRGHRVGADST